MGLWKNFKSLFTNKTADEADKPKHDNGDDLLEALIHGREITREMAMSTLPFDFFL